MNKEIALIFLLVVLSTKLCIGQIIPDHTKLPPVDSLSNQDFEAIAPYIKNKRVILAGEASHGGHEFFAVKAALFKYLVEEQGVKHFVLEENLAVCEKFDAYIAGTLQADAKTLVKEANYTWPYHTAEFSNLLEWMKAYNATKPQAQKIKLWGIDIQFAYQSLRLLQERIRSIDSSIDLHVPEVPRQERYKYRVPDSTVAAIEALVGSLGNSSPDKAYLARHLEAVKMKNTYSSMQHDGMYSTETSSRYRDSCMAVNVNRILTYVGKENKMMVWAHNVHVAKSFDTAVRKAPMGAFLREMVPGEVLSIGFDYNQGELLLNVPNQGFRPIGVQPRVNHYLARLLDKEQYQLLFIGASERNQPLFSRSLHLRNEHVLVESSYGELFDAIFFVNRVSATTRIE